jgi:hypothetical protein
LVALLQKSFVEKGTAFFFCSLTIWNISDVLSG